MPNKLHRNYLRNPVGRMRIEKENIRQMKEKIKRKDEREQLCKNIEELEK